MATRRHAPSPGDLADIEEFAAGLSSSHLECRAVTGHNFRRLSVRWLEDDKAHEIRMRCRQCGANRLVLIDAMGYPVRSAYKYKKGYLAKKVKGTATQDGRALLRLEAMTRAENR